VVQKNSPHRYRQSGRIIQTRGHSCAGPRPSRRLGAPNSVGPLLHADAQPKCWLRMRWSVRTPVTEDPQRAEGHDRRHQCGREAGRIKPARHACDALIVSAPRRGPRHWRARRRPRLWRGHFLLHLHLLPVGRAPFLVVAGGWMAATATVALAEEVAELVRG